MLTPDQAILIDVCATLEYRVEKADVVNSMNRDELTLYDSAMEYLEKMYRTHPLEVSTARRLASQR